MTALLLIAAVEAGTANLATDYRSAREFADAVRAATARYHDRSVAITEGYRQIGRDFPGMGEHWINIGLVFDGRHEPTRPEFLSYVTVAGVPALVGVAYAVALLPGESPPEWPWADVAWHDHVRSVDEETLIPHGHEARHGGHAAGHGTGGGASADEPRLAMAHAWVWLPNPDGDFASDNWALPYFRLGLTAPEQARPDSARALTLLTGGDEYVTDVVAPVGSRAEKAALQRAVERARRSVTAVLAPHRDRGPRLDERQLRALARTWARLWKDLDRALASPSRARLEPLR
jgi:hypothetical protein